MSAAHLRPPKYLKAETKRWWQDVVDSYTLEPHHVELLTLAAEARDRTEAAAAVIRRQGATFVDRHGQPRARPEVAIERDSRLAFARLLRELALVEDNVTDCRPPRLRGTG